MYPLRWTTHKNQLTCLFLLQWNNWRCNCESMTVWFPVVFSLNCWGLRSVSQSLSLSSRVELCSTTFFSHIDGLFSLDSGFHTGWFSLGQVWDSLRNQCVCVLPDSQSALVMWCHMTDILLYATTFSRVGFSSAVRLLIHSHTRLTHRA